MQVAGSFYRRRKSSTLQLLFRKVQSVGPPGVSGGGWIT